jgi:hypothetical protein
MRYSGFDHDPARFLLFAVRPSSSGQSQGADQRRKSDALQHKRYDDDAERQKDDQVPLREPGAVS